MQNLYQKEASKLKDCHFENCVSTELLVVFIQQNWTTLYAFFSTQISNEISIHNLKIFIDSLIVFIQILDEFGFDTQ
jgi:hypothetical protein